MCPSNPWTLCIPINSLGNTKGWRMRPVSAASVWGTWGGDGWGAECSVGLSVKLEGMCTLGLSFFPAPCPLDGPFVHTYYFPSASCQSHLLAHPNTHPTCGPNQYGYVGLTISTQ